MDPITFRDACPEDIPWLVARHAAIYRTEAGFDDSFAPLVAQVLRDYFSGRDPVRERAFVPVAQAADLGSLFVTNGPEPDTAQLRLFWLEPEWRGQRLAQRMLGMAKAHARATGRRRLLVRTYDRHAAAVRLYENAGFTCIQRKPARAFGQDLIEQAWRYTL